MNNELLCCSQDLVCPIWDYFIVHTVRILVLISQDSRDPWRYTFNDYDHDHYVYCHYDQNQYVNGNVIYITIIARALISASRPLVAVLATSAAASATEATAASAITYLSIGIIVSLALSLAAYKKRCRRWSTCNNIYNNGGKCSMNSNSILWSILPLDAHYSNVCQS